MKDLKELLKWELGEKGGITTNLFDNNKEIAKHALDKALESDSGNSIDVEIEYEGNPCILETNLYKKEVYLLESRLFDQNKDNMINSYLRVVESDGNPLDLDNDCWGTTDWTLKE